MKLCYHCMQQIRDDRAQVCPNCGKELRVQQVRERFLKPGTVLQKKFIVGYPLGAGGFGNTYIGWNRVLLRKVAIKEFYPEQYIGRSADGVTVTVPDTTLQPRFRKGLQQFLEEARSVAALQNIQGVVEISNFFEENGTGYIVMEYLEGMDVKTILKKSGDKKDYEWSRRVILTVLHTLRDIHKRGVLHRDIAPDNIFVTNEGVIKLIDFGAARHASALANMKSDVVLKVGYAPIEQYSRNSVQGPYTDLYAVAALFYRMLTGQKPIPANERLKQDPLIPPSEMGVKLPEQAEMAIMVCLNVKPEYRLQSAEDFMEALGGKDFVPVYEPKWILPPVEEKKGFAGRIAGLPVMAKAGICLGCICLIAGIAAGAVAIVNSRAENERELTAKHETGKIRIEDYTGKSCEDVIRDLELDGYEKDVKVTYDFSDEEEGVVTKQSVAPAEEIAADGDLELTVSGGNTYYTMPDFSNLSEEEAIAFFTERNFNVEVHADPYDIDVHTVEGQNENLERQNAEIFVNRYFVKDVGEGVCYDQSVHAGEKCDAQESVTVFVSMGGEESDFVKKIPDFSGLTKEEAEKKLKESKCKDILKLKFEDSSEFRDGIEAGQINRQSIDTGTEINLIRDKGTELILYVQKQKPQASKPAVQNTSSGSGIKSSVNSGSTSNSTTKAKKKSGSSKKKSTTSKKTKKTKKKSTKKSENSKKKNTKKSGNSKKKNTKKSKKKTTKKMH